MMHGLHIKSEQCLHVGSWYVLERAGEREREREREMPCVRVCRQVPSCRSPNILEAFAQASLGRVFTSTCRATLISFRLSESFPALSLTNCSYPNSKFGALEWDHSVAVLFLTAFCSTLCMIRSCYVALSCERSQRCLRMCWNCR